VSLDTPSHRSRQGGGFLGFLFGAFIGGLLGLWAVSDRGSAWWFLLALPLGLLGARYGDRFFHWIGGVLRFLTPS
jgi:hypothetical protein